MEPAKIENGSGGRANDGAAEEALEPKREQRPSQAELADQDLAARALPNRNTDQRLDLILDPSNMRDPPSERKRQMLVEFQPAPTSPISAPITTSEPPSAANKIRATRKRYFILFMFFILQIVKSFQWICLASITNVVARFYQVDNMAINWTTILFMVTFLVLAVPVGWIMDFIGLRRSVLVGAIGVTVGVVIKCFSCHRDGFATSMWGHLIVGICEPFFFSSYSQLASVWFPDHQVALAVSVCLIGEQMGIALGFIIPPLVIGPDPNDFDAIQRGLWGLFVFVAVISVLNCLSIMVFFDEEPRLAPGIARFKQKQDESIRRQSLQVELEKRRLQRRRSSNISRRLSQTVSEQFKLSVKNMQDRHFMLLLAGFGICQGICYSIHTLLNQMIVQPISLIDLPIISLSGSRANEQAAAAASAANSSTSPDQAPELVALNGEETETLVVGNAGLILILSGQLGAACLGYLLDKYHKHKQTTTLVYLLNLLAMLAFTASLPLGSPLALYLAAIPLGFGQLAYATCAFDYSVELTYPRPELVSSTLLNISAQLFGIPISLLGSLIVDNLGSLALGAFFSVLLLVGLVITCLQGGELRRQSAVTSSEAANKMCRQLDLTSKKEQISGESFD